MAYTVSRIRNSQPDVLSTAASDAETSAQRVNAQIIQGREQMNTLREDWIGTASDAAVKQYGELIGYQQAYRETLATLRATLNKNRQGNQPKQPNRLEQDHRTDRPDQTVRATSLRYLLLRRPGLAEPSRCRRPRRHIDAHDLRQVAPATPSICPR
ncbi:WXG100 family type VII secretion target [Mycolicibacterium fortuitum]|uniref:WXG100 family type VII secretion target n=1 Tax=Mycolicibacterium fortuitum TaxID=1766 RepID=UPI0009430B64|nr:WXG100 family type VII secretion target [Mycolicibacterium fortuitum]